MSEFLLEVQSKPVSVVLTNYLGSLLANRANELGIQTTFADTFRANGGDSLDLADLDGTMLSLSKMARAGINNLSAMLMRREVDSISIQDCLMDGVDVGDHPEKIITVSSRPSKEKLFNPRAISPINTILGMPWYAAKGHSPDSITELGIKKDNVREIFGRGKVGDEDTEKLIIDLNKQFQEKKPDKVAFHSDAISFPTILKDMLRIVFGNNLNTTHDINFAKRVKELCDEHNIPFEYVMVNQRFN